MSCTVGIDPGSARIGVAVVAAGRLVRVDLIVPSPTLLTDMLSLTAGADVIAVESTTGGRAAGLPAALRDTLLVEGLCIYGLHAQPIRRVDVLRQLGVPLSLPRAHTDAAVRDALRMVVGDVGGARCPACAGRGRRQRQPCPDCDGGGRTPLGPLGPLASVPALARGGQDAWDAVAVAVAAGWPR